MRNSAGLIGAMSAALLVSCDQADRPEPTAVELPNFSQCNAAYSAEPGGLDAALDRGEPEAMLCQLSFSEGLGTTLHDLEYWYRYYRQTGIESEQFEELLARFDRGQLAVSLVLAHKDSPELAAFDTDSRGCPDYDEIATELLLRVEFGDGDRRCLPRRGWW